MTYKVSLNSSTLKIDNNEANNDKDFIAHITPINRSATYLCLPNKIGVAINGSEVGEDKYTYSVNEDYASFKVNANEIKGDIIITADCERKIDRVGGYLRQYIKDTSLSFSLNLKKDKTYFVIANTNNNSDLKIYYKKTTGEEILLENYRFKCESDELYTFIVKANNPINDYVSATLSEVVNINNPSDKFILYPSYNDKVVVFSYRPLVSSIFKPSLTTMPIIKTSDKYSLESPTDLKELLPGPVIYDELANSDAILEFEKKNNYYLPKDNKKVVQNNECDYYFFTYVKNVPSGEDVSIKIDNGFLISDTINDDIIVNEGTIYLYVNNLVAQASYLVQNIDLLKCQDILDIHTYNSIQPTGDIFTPISDGVILVYKFENTAKLSETYIYKYNKDIKDNTFTLKDEDKNQEVMFISPNAKMIEKTVPAYTDFTFVIEENSSVNTTIDRLNSTYTKVIEGQSVNADIVFDLATTLNNRKYYLAKNAVAIDKPYLYSDSRATNVSLDRFLAKFNSGVKNNDSLFIRYANVNILQDLTPNNYTIESVGNIDYKTAITGVPYSCRLLPSKNYAINKSDIKVSINNEEIPFEYDIKTHILSFNTDKVGAMKFTVTPKVGVFNLIAKSNLPKGPTITLTSNVLSKINPSNVTASLSANNEYIFNDLNVPKASTESGKDVSLSVIDVKEDKKEMTISITPPIDTSDNSIIISYVLTSRAHAIKYQTSNMSKMTNSNPIISISSGVSVNIAPIDSRFALLDMPDKSEVVLKDVNGVAVAAAESIEKTDDDKSLLIKFAPLSLDKIYSDSDFILTSLDGNFCSAPILSFNPNAEPKNCYLKTDSGEKFVHLSFDKEVEVTIKANIDKQLVPYTNYNIDNFTYSLDGSIITPKSVRLISQDNSIVLTCPSTSRSQANQNAYFTNSAAIDAYFEEIQSHASLKLSRSSDMCFLHGDIVYLSSLNEVEARIDTSDNYHLIENGAIDKNDFYYTDEEDTTRIYPKSVSLHADYPIQNKYLSIIYDKIDSKDANKKFILNVANIEKYFEKSLYINNAVIKNTGKVALMTDTGSTKFYFGHLFNHHYVRLNFTVVDKKDKFYKSIVHANNVLIHTFSNAIRSIYNLEKYSWISASGGYSVGTVGNPEFYDDYRVCSIIFNFSFNQSYPPGWCDIDLNDIAPKNILDLDSMVTGEEL